MMDFYFVNLNNLSKVNIGIGALIAIIFGICIVCTICFFLFKIRRVKKKTIGLATFLTFLLSIILLEILLTIYLVLYTDRTFKDLFSILVLPLIVGLITSLLSSIFQIFLNKNMVDDVILPSVPTTIYPQRESPEGALSDDLIEELGNSINYMYSGVRMSISTKCLAEVLTKGICKLSSLHFFIPKPENGQLGKDELEAMTQSLDTLKKSFASTKYTQKIELKLTLLDFLPPFHVHLTNNKCWFALVETNADGIPYPTTYLYENTKSEIFPNIPRNSTAMFDTIKKMMEVLKENSSIEGTENYTFIFKANNTQREKSFKINGKDVIEEIKKRITESIKSQNEQKDNKQNEQS